MAASSPHAPCRVLMISTIPIARNGQTMFIVRLAAAMEHTQVDLMSYALNDAIVAQSISDHGGQVLLVPNRLKHPLRYLCRVSRLVRENSYNVVHVHGNSCTLAIELLAAKLGGAKVRIAHSHNSHCKFLFLHRLLRPLFDRFYTQGFACGQEAGKWLFGKKPFSVVPNAIDVNAYAFNADARARFRRELGLSNSDVALGCAARLSGQKNHAFLLKAFAQAVRSNPNLILILAGDGPLRAELSRQAQDLKIIDRVRFLGLREDIPELLSAMDAMVLSSLFEGFPTVALEWQCSGLPTLLSDTITRDCALTENVRFLPLDIDSWADAMKKTTVCDRNETSPAGIAAVRRAGYNLADTAARMESNYDRFIRVAK